MFQKYALPVDGHVVTRNIGSRVLGMTVCGRMSPLLLEKYFA